jgi:cell division septation protein DedD
MDIANYLSELLGRHTEVSVPGLGCFSQQRINGYYDDAQGTFFPPGFKLNFESQPKDDEILARYIAEKKKISLASSKYFTEKYINSLKQELVLHEVTFAELGWFYLQDGKIAFRTQEKQANDPLFFGLAPVKINKVNYVAPPPPPPPLPAAVTLQQTFTPPPIPTTINTTPEQQPEYVYDEPEEKRGTSVWIIIAIVVVVLAAAAFAVYKFKPELLHLDKKETAAPVEKPKAEPVLKPDTIKKDSVSASPDTAKAISQPTKTLNEPVVVTDSTAKPEYAIFLGSFKTKVKSEEAIKDYKHKGITARAWTGPGTGIKIKIIIGGFASSDEAETQRKKLISQGKIAKDTYSKLITDSTK